MLIEIWSDVVCPWCYIGKRRIGKAIAAFAHADEVEVHWRSFQLDPGAPTEPTEGTGAMLARKCGQPPEGAKEMQDRVEAVAAEDGLVYRLHLGHEQGGSDLQGRVKEAYFTDARNVADHTVLREVGVSAGLNATRVGEVLASTEYVAEVLERAWADSRPPG